MLPTASRLRDSDDFSACVRRGVRVGRATLVVHALRTDCPPARAGFVVSKAVGNAVTRNRVKRRLRHLAAELVVGLEVGVDVVVRALPPAASAAATELRNDLGSAWDASLAKLGATA